MIAAEDQTFFEHRGFDVDSIQDAVAEAQQGGRVRGASTISQQVSKNLFLWPGRSVTRKGLEAYVTVFVELFWPKRRILEVYLNVAEFGDGIYGIAAASDHFFDTVPARIDADQAALLAAVLPNPKRLKVDEPSVYVRERQAWIRTQMIQLGGTEATERHGTLSAARCIRRKVLQGERDIRRLRSHDPVCAHGERQPRRRARPGRRHDDHRPAPAQSGRPPPSQRRPLSRRHRPHAVPSADR